MGKQCGVAHEISSIKAPLFHHGGLLEGSWVDGWVGRWFGVGCGVGGCWWVLVMVWVGDWWVGGGGMGGVGGGGCVGWWYCGSP